MTQENDKTLDDLEQLLARVRENLEAIELLKETAPDYSKDIAEIHENSIKLVAGLEDIAARAREEGVNK